MATASKKKRTGANSIFWGDFYHQQFDIVCYLQLIHQVSNFLIDDRTNAGKTILYLCKLKVLASQSSEPSLQYVYSTLHNSPAVN